jgi:HAMP domain-containing protein
LLTAADKSIASLRSALRKAKSRSAAVVNAAPTGGPRQSGLARERTGRHHAADMRSEPSLETRSAAAWCWALDPRRNLCLRAVLVFGGGALALTLLASLLAGALFRRQLEAQLGRTFETLAYQMSDKLDRTIAERLRDVQVIADLAPIRDPAAPAAERRRVLDAFRESSPDYAWLGLVDNAGTVVAAAQGLFEGTPMDGRTWFRRTRAQPYAGDVYKDDELAKLLPSPDGEAMRFLDVAAPVRGLAGQTIGVVGAQVHWAWARQVQYSVVPAAARREHLGVTVYAADGKCLLDSGASGWSEPLDAPKVPGPRQFRGYFWESGPGGDAFLTGYARSRGFRDFQGLGWVVTVRQAARDVLAPVRELQASILRWGVGLVALFALWGWFFAWRLTRRLHAMAAAADRIRGGDILSVLPLPRSQDEFGQMSAALGEMVDGLRQRQEGTERDCRRLEARLKETGGDPGGDNLPKPRS